MTNTTTEDSPFPIGDRYAVGATVNITSLGADGTETWDPDSELDHLDAVDRVYVGSQESESYRITFDHVNDQFDVVNVDDGTDVGSTTDVGEVGLLALGLR